MQSIVTKFLPCTNTRGSRIKASCDRGSITIGYPDVKSGEDAHREALQQLLEKFCREDEEKYGESSRPWNGAWITGGLPNNGGCCHVYIDRED